MRLIDADAEVKKREKLCEEKNCEYLKYRYQAMCKGCPIYEEIEAFDSAEKVEAEPVRHGRWKGWTTSKFTGKYEDYDEPVYKDYVYYTCSECYRKSAIRELYCPNCGAYMREEGAENG